VGARAGRALDPGKGIEGMPGRVDPEPFARPRRPDRLAYQREDERLGNAHDGEFVPGIASAMNAALGIDHRYAEKLRGNARQRRIDGRHIALVHAGKPGMGLSNQCIHPRGGGKRSGRYVGLPRIEKGIKQFHVGLPSAALPWKPDAPNNIYSLPLSGKTAIFKLILLIFLCFCTEPSAFAKSSTTRQNLTVLYVGIFRPLTNFISKHEE